MSTSWPDTSGHTPPRPVSGLIGLGNMGAAVASRLTALGPLVTYDLDAERARTVAEHLDGVEVVAEPEQVVADVVVLSLPSPDISLSVVERLTRTLASGSVVVETSTVNPSHARSMAELLGEAGIGFVDAAILSGVAPMTAGESALLIGGEPDVVERARPVLDALASRQRHLGPPGAGMAAKVINNAVAHAVMVVLAEANALARANQVEAADLVELLAAPDGGLLRPLTHRLVERVHARDFEGGMPTEAARKDSTLALAMAQDEGVPLFAIQAAHTVYDLACAAGLDRLDYAAIATLWDDHLPGSRPRSRDAAT